SESRTSMGIVVIGGLIFATILTLYVIPAVYTYLSSKSTSVSNIALEEEPEYEPVEEREMEAVVVDE
ncbi:MAG TPA: efflux RND transporter permease subunit, partial [bacterium]|nr:efflux RND transporter permease subunit [bacterium]